MEADVAVLFQRPDPWTFERLQELPIPDGTVDWRRFEIVDGALVVSPAPGGRHELVLFQLRRMFYAMLPDEIADTATLGVAIGTSHLVPDLALVEQRVLEQMPAVLRPSDARLVVEVVSPGSRRMGRITKPDLYAEAGIPFFWRIETQPDIELVAYALHDGAYREVGTWHRGEIAEIAEPFPVRIDVGALLPAPSEGE